MLLVKVIWRYLSNTECKCNTECPLITRILGFEKKSCYAKFTRWDCSKDSTDAKVFHLREHKLKTAFLLFL